MEGRLGKLLNRLAVMAARTQAKLVDQTTVHQQIGITADRRGEVSIAFQRQAEVTFVIGVIDRLGLYAQDGILNDAQMRPLRGGSQSFVEERRMICRAFRCLHAKEVQVSTQIGNFAF